MAITLPADGIAFTSLEVGSSFGVHCFNFSFVSGVQWWTQVSSTVFKHRKESFLFRLKLSRHDREMSNRSWFWRTVSKRDTQRGLSFFIPTRRELSKNYGMRSAHFTHGEKFGGSARPTRKTDALNTRRAAQPLWSNSSTNLGVPWPQNRRGVTRNTWASRSLASFVVSLG